MEIERHLEVIRRSKALLGAGVVLGLLFAVLAGHRVLLDGGPKLEPRQAETWTSSSELLVTAGDEPYTNFKFPDPALTAHLAFVYSRFFESDRIESRLGRLPEDAEIAAVALPASQNSSEVLPVIALDTSAQTSEAARSLNAALISAFRQDLTLRQERNGQRPQGRIRLEVLKRPQAAVLTKGRKPTLPIMVFLLTVAGALGAAYVRENLRLSRDREQGQVADIGLDWTGDARAVAIETRAASSRRSRTPRSP